MWLNHDFTRGCSDSIWRKEASTPKGIDIGNCLWHFAAMFYAPKFVWPTLTWLILVFCIGGHAQAWSPDGVFPDSTADITPGLERSDTCSDWRLGTVNQLAPALTETPCKLRGRAPIQEWPRTVSIGSPSRGALVYGRPLQPNRYLTSRPAKRYGTHELVETIERAVAVVNASHPNTPVLHVGDLSRRNGGFFPPHVSHQSGCDVDIGYYLKRNHRPHAFSYATPRTIDVPRTWTLIRGFLETEAAVYIFSDKRLIPLLKRHAYREGSVPKPTLDRWFKSGILRHLKGHADHLHIRIRAPESVAAVHELTKEIGHRAVRRMMTPVPIYTKIRSGDSLGRIAARTRVSQKKIRRYNRLRGASPKIYAGKRLIIGYRYPSVNLKPTSKRAKKYAPRKKRAFTIPNRKRAEVQQSFAGNLARKKGKTSRRLKNRTKKRGTRTHVVKRGENLSVIAHRYRVPTASLCAINKLVKDCSWKSIRKRPVHLKIGQRLRIPKRR